MLSKCCVNRAGLVCIDGSIVNIAMVLDQAADYFGDRVAFGSRESGLTYIQLREHARAMAHHVERGGIEKVALASAGSGPIVPAMLFGAAWGGAAYIPLNPRVGRESLQRLISRLAPVVVADSTWLGLRRPSQRVEFVPDPKSPALVIFTSGTSADPKAAILGHEHLLTNVLGQGSLGSADDEEAVLLAAPPFHVPSVLIVLGSVYAGRRIVPLPGERFSARQWLTTARAESVTSAMLVPTMLHRIVDALEREPGLRVPTLRRLVYGSARMPLPVLERALRLFPDTEFVNGYGLTETSGAVAALGPIDHRRALESDNLLVRARLGSVGRPLPGVEIRIINDDGVDAESGESGEIQIRGRQVSGHYLEVAARVYDDGWLRSGDRGWFDADGYLFCEGRGTDTIIRGGENIGVAEIEDTLLKHPAVSEVAVVGVPDMEWGERIGAMVVNQPGATTADTDHLREWVRRQLGSLKVPELITIAKELPQTPTGKILYREVLRRIVESTSLPVGEP